MNLNALIRDVNPAPYGAVPGPESLEARSILRQLGAETAARRRRPVLVGGLSIGTLGAVAAAVLVVMALLPGSPTRPVSAAAATLAQLADTAASQPAVDAPDPG